MIVTIPVRPFWSLSLTHVPENASTGHRAIKVVNQAPHTHVLQLQRASVATKAIPPPVLALRTSNHTAHLACCHKEHLVTLQLAFYKTRHLQRSMRETPAHFKIPQYEYT